MAAPTTKKKATSRKSEVEDWTARKSFEVKPWGGIEIEVGAGGGHAEAGAAAGGGGDGIEDGGLEEFFGGDVADGEADADGDEEAEDEAQDCHLQRVLAAKGGVGAEGDDGADDGRAHHVGDGAGERQAFANEAADDDDAAALAHGHEEAEQSGGDNGCGVALGEPAAERLGGHEGIDDAGDDCAEQQEGDALEQDAEEGVREV